MQKKKYTHVELIEKIGGVNIKAGSVVAGNRGYYLVGSGVFLSQALQRLAIDILVNDNYIPVYPPTFMKRYVMEKVAQLSQFDDELYKVNGDADDEENPHDKYLIATSEQPIAAMHIGQRISRQKLPIKYTGISNCFRKETGRHRHDTLGIFRVHQFEKIEQFVITDSEGKESWDAMENMIANSETFLKDLEIPYRVVNIVSGELNDSASKKLDVEGWFAGSGNFKELVSCSNCLDYQSRRLGIKNDRGDCVHMLNATMCAVTRMICVLLENHQTDTGIAIPPSLSKYMPSMYSKEIPFLK